MSSAIFNIRNINVTTATSGERTYFTAIHDTILIYKLPFGSFSGVRYAAVKSGSSENIVCQGYPSTSDSFGSPEGVVFLKPGERFVVRYFGSPTRTANLIALEFSRNINVENISI